MSGGASIRAQIIGCLVLLAGLSSLQACGHAGDSDNPASGGRGGSSAAGAAGTPGVAGRGGASSAGQAGGPAGTSGVAGIGEGGSDGAGTGGSDPAGHGGGSVGGASGGGGGRGGGSGGGAGSPGAGGSTGAAGSAPTACNLPNHSGNGSFTNYSFSQGTYYEMDNKLYRTACGYAGTGNPDTVQNIANKSPAKNTYFAAIPGKNDFDTKDHCGECVLITGQNGKQIIATIIDECPYGSGGQNGPCASNPSGHLDLSVDAFNQLGYPTGNPSGTNWKYVPCPVTGNLVARVKPSNPNELFIENTILNITAVEGATRQSYGAWHFNSNLSEGQQLKLTDQANRTVTITLTSTAQGQNQDTGVQFPGCL
jgi:hypothetical protein